MIEKPTILITSIGRTGTEFFSRFYTHILPTSTCLHEPDIVQNTGVDNRLLQYAWQVRRAGIWRMIILKAIGKWTLVSLSDSRLLGHLRDNAVLRELDYQRKDFINAMPGTVYMEANIGYYGLLDLIPNAFAEHRAVYLVRDGRDWVRSHMNWGEFYGKRGFRKLISHNWPTAGDVFDDPYAEEWQEFSRFEKLCWAWSRLNEYALARLSKNPHARLYRFEQVFLEKGRYDVLQDLVNFTIMQPGIDFASTASVNGWLDRRIHQSAGGFPVWENWSEAQKQQFERICSPLMEKLGYEIR